jgi:hypothetical protein
VWNGKQLPTFQRIVVHESSGSSSTLGTEDKVTDLLEHLKLLPGERLQHLR